MKLKTIFSAALMTSLLFSCGEDKKAQTTEDTSVKKESTFDYNVDTFADIKILRYQIPSWDNLSLKQQQLAYYLTQAGLAGRDIMWDQNYRHNLAIRAALENV